MKKEIISQIIIVICVAVAAFMIGRNHRSEQIFKLQSNVRVRQTMIEKTAVFLNNSNLDNTTRKMINDRIGYNLPMRDEKVKGK